MLNMEESTLNNLALKELNDDKNGRQYVPYYPDSAYFNDGIAFLFGVCRYRVFRKRVNCWVDTCEHFPINLPCGSDRFMMHFYDNPICLTFFCIN